MTATASAPVIVIAATPTSNGDLHVGHLSGPYLAGDIYARYMRANGRQVIYTTCTDDSQSYVLSTARRLGTTPEALRDDSTAAIDASLQAIGVSMPGLPPIDAAYRETVLEFVRRLRENGRLELRKVRLPYAERAGTYLYDGLVRGTCPVCMAASSGGACEDCGHPNNFDELLDPHSTLDPSDPVSYRECEILVLPMEQYRQRLEAYYAAHTPSWRPHARQLIGELLARPLPDAPITIPGGWGIPAPFPETAGQIVYPWVEAMPASIYSTWWTVGDPAAERDLMWRASTGAEIVYFHGFDNVFHWGLMDLVMLMAHGERYVTPAGNVCNEFYDLDGEKFSTSRNHLIKAGALLAEVPRDLVRFYLALTGPEYQRTNFTRDLLESVTQRQLVGPWNALADAVDAAVHNINVAAGARADGDWIVELPTTESGRRRAAAMVQRFRLCYDLADYSPSRAAGNLIGQLGRLVDLAGHIAPGDLLLAVRTLVACAAPILIDVAEQLATARVDLALTDEPADSVAVFRLPRIGAGVGAGRLVGVAA